MAEYILSPESRQQPSAFQLIEELHRRGYPVEIHLNGEDHKWESIQFSEAGSPDTTCSLTFNSTTGRYTISIASNALAQAGDLQLSLVDSLLQSVGGHVDNTGTLERYTPEQFKAKLRRSNPSAGRGWDLFWVFFAWAVVIGGLVVYFSIEDNRRYMVMMIIALSSLSAAGLTYSHIKND
jgi:hypothetical protein